MANKPRWTIGDTVNGVVTAALSSWKHFQALVHSEFLESDNYIWRGQASATWPLESRLERLLKARARPEKKGDRERHLRAFKLAVRGRRGPSPPGLSTEDEWWALGQHYGLATPLLDWTRSPFVALYFAFEKPASTVGVRAVYAFAEDCADQKCTGGKLAPNSDSRTVVQIVSPLIDENARLVNQAGLFTRLPDKVTLESWAKKALAGYQQDALVRITIPNKDREGCLRFLNHMNINHVSLFPDVYGASMYCNRGLEIHHYGLGGA